MHFKPFCCVLTVFLVAESSSVFATVGDDSVRRWQLGAYAVHVQKAPFRLAVAYDGRPIFAQRDRPWQASIAFLSAGGWHSFTDLDRATFAPAAGPASRDELKLSISGPDSIRAEVAIDVGPEGTFCMRVRTRGGEVLGVRMDCVVFPDETWFGVDSRPLRGPRAELPVEERWLFSSRGLAVRVAGARKQAVWAFAPDPDSYRLEVQGSVLDVRLMKRPSHKLAWEVSSRRRASTPGDSDFWLRVDTLPDAAALRRLRNRFESHSIPLPLFYVATADSRELIDPWSGVGGAQRRPTRERLHTVRDPAQWPRAVRTALVQALMGESQWLAVPVELLGRDAAGQHSEYVARWLTVAACQPVLAVDCSAVPSEPASGVDLDRLHGLVARHRAFCDYSQVVGGAWLPLFVAQPANAVAYSIEDAWLHGSADGPTLLVAPLLTPGARSRRVYFPAGVWSDIQTGVNYRGGGWQVVQIESVGFFERVGAKTRLKEFLSEPLELNTGE